MSKRPYLSLEPAGKPDQYKIRFDEGRAYDDGVIKYRPLAPSKKPAIGHIALQSNGMFACDDDDFSEFATLAEAAEFLMQKFEAGK